MKKAILIPDSFKNSLSSLEVCHLMEQAIHQIHPACEIIKIPISDGGEGLVDCYLSVCKGQKIRVKTQDPFGIPIDSFYGMLQDGTAIIELAASAGLPLVKRHPDPSMASTYGVGELIVAALKNHANKIILGLGGSATNDAGVGMARALGVRFFDTTGAEFSPSGRTLDRIADISIDHLNTDLKNVLVTTLCDVTNPLTGAKGAARVFARQKGADENMIAMLDRNLTVFAALLKKKYDFDTDFAGAGAAGGTTVAAKLFLHSDIQSGIETILDLVQFDQLLPGCDIVLTGEGRLDAQSFHGKVIGGIAARTARSQVPLIAVVGQIGDVDVSDYPAGLTAAFPILRKCSSFEQAVRETPNNLLLTVENICRLY